MRARPAREKGAAAGPPPVSLILFEVGDRVMAADATQVVRIAPPEPGLREFAGPATARRGERALVFKIADGEGQLRVDQVRGLRHVPVQELRRIPAAAHASAAALGFWLDGDNAVLLIQLSEALQEGGR